MPKIPSPIIGKGPSYAQIRYEYFHCNKVHSKALNTYDFILLTTVIHCFVDKVVKSVTSLLFNGIKFCNNTGNKMYSKLFV